MSSKNLKLFLKYFPYILSQVNIKKKTIHYLSRVFNTTYVVAFVILYTIYFFPSHKKTILSCDDNKSKKKHTHGASAAIEAIKIWGNCQYQHLRHPELYVAFEPLKG